MASSTTSNVYIHVIEDVVNKVRGEFNSESVLSELERVWKLKMMQAGAIVGPIPQRGAVGPNTVHHLNVPKEEPTGDLLFPPVYQQKFVQGGALSSKISQFDGPYDDALSTPNIYNFQGVGVDDDDEHLNENDDDLMDQGQDLNTTHLILAQFHKVKRTKSTWKCTLKDGIMHINNRDILFNEATGEFDF